MPDSVLLGPSLGRMVEIRCPSSQNVSVDDGMTLERTLEGEVQAQVLLNPHARSWDIRIGAGTPADLANMLAFAIGEFGRGPFVWVSADAPVTNMMTPDASVCGPSVIAGPAEIKGPMNLPGGGVAGRSLYNPTITNAMHFGPATVPVRALQPVTASAYLIGAGARMGVGFYNDAGQYIDGISSAALGSAGVSKRISMSTIAPAGAVSCQPVAQSAVYGARPAVTWTSEVFDWQPGEGCNGVVLSGLSRDVILALSTPGYGRHSNLSITATEVGP